MYKALLFSLLILLTSPSIASAQVLINEVFPNPSGDEKQDEWVELFNTSNQEIDLAGYKLKDAANHELVIDTTYVDVTTVISAGAWLVVSRNGHASFSLNNGDETVYLFDSSTSDSISTFQYSGSETDKSWGRIPDGNVISSELLDPTPGTANQPPPTPTNTPTPTTKPTSTPKPSKTPTPTNTPTPKPTVKAAATKAPTGFRGSSTDEGERESLTLGLRDELSVTPTPSESSELGRGGKFPWLAGVFILAGAGFIGAAVYPFLKKRYNLGSETKQKDN